MFSTGEVQGIISEDTDMLPYGCECFVTEFKYNSEYVTEYQLSKVLEDLKMSREQFVDVCILCGCDYSEKIYKIAIKGALEKIRLYGNIEGVISHIKSRPKLMEVHTYPKDFMDQVQRARNMFLTRCADGVAKPLEEPIAHLWNFAAADEKGFQQFIKDHSMSTTAYSMLTKPWAGVAKGQQTLLQFFGKK
jgi:5'-3' exonuclease